jgi:hypothetical protein
VVVGIGVSGDAGATVNFDVCVVVAMLLIIVVWLKVNESMHG